MILMYKRDNQKHLKNIIMSSIIDTAKSAIGQTASSKKSDGSPHLILLTAASGFVMHVEHNERDLLDPAIKGTTEVLKAVQKNAPQVKRIVITSSFAAMMDPTQGVRPGYTYTEKDWNPVTYVQAKGGDGGTAYCASKTFAEKAA